MEVQRGALALNENDPDTLAQLGWRLAARGEFDEGIAYLERAVARSANPPGWYFHLLAVRDYLEGDYQHMLEAAERSAVDGSGISWSFIAIACAALGQLDEARPLSIAGRRLTLRRTGIRRRNTVCTAARTIRWTRSWPACGRLGGPNRTAQRISSAERRDTNAAWAIRALSARHAK